MKFFEREDYKIVLSLIFSTIFFIVILFLYIFLEFSATGKMLMVASLISYGIFLTNVIIWYKKRNYFIK